MPISNGYETCKNILDLYDSNQESLFSYNSIEIRRLKPIMIACTSHVDQNILRLTKEAGFNQTLQCPLRYNDIEDLIMPLLG